MEFNKKQKTFIKILYSDINNITKVSELYCKEFNITNTYHNVESYRKKISKFLDKNNITDNKVRLEDSKEYINATKRELNNSKFYIVTWEQNSTPLHKEFWDNLIAYKEYLGAELSVILGRYKNPTSIFTDLKNEKWSKITEQYHDASRHDIHKFLTVLSDVKISPTKKYPLTGLQGLSQGKSIIVGHPKLHLKTEPTLNGYSNKMLFTTGSCTVPNYTDSGVGKISEGVHKLGFVIVEIKDDEIFFIRQVEATSDGNFIDLMHKVEDGKVTIHKSAKGLICGDTHYGHLDSKIDSINDKICEYFNINTLVLHDVIDGESCNNHILKSPIEQYKRYKNGKHLIEEELISTAKWLENKLKYGVVIPRANHNDRFDRILNQDWRKDVQNSLFYFKYTTAVMEGKAYNGVLSYFLHDKFGNNINCLGYQDSFKIGKYECSQHGDNGSNGARGSMVGFRNLEIPMILAHTHTLFRADDVLYCGTNTMLNLGYNEKGASNWAQGNVIVGDNDIAQHIIFVKGEFTTFKI